eukprot:3524466-Rhodomonas_salina.2
MSEELPGGAPPGGGANRAFDELLRRRLLARDRLGRNGSESVALAEQLPNARSELPFLHARRERVGRFLVLIVLAEALQEDRDEEVHDDVVAEDDDADREQRGQRVVGRHDAVVHDRVPVLGGDDLERDEKRPVPVAGREERVEVRARKVRLHVLELAPEVLHPEQRENVHEDHPDQRQRPQRAQRNAQRLQDLSHAIPRSRELEQTEQPHAPQSREVRATVPGPDASDAQLDDACGDDEKVKLVEAVLEVVKQAQSEHLEQHLDHEQERQHNVDVLEHAVERLGKRRTLRQAVSAQVPQTQILVRDRGRVDAL